MSARLFLEKYRFILFFLIKVYVTFNFTAYFFSNFLSAFSGGYFWPFSGLFSQLIQLDVPAIIKRTASGSKWPYLVRMNIHMIK